MPYSFLQLPIEVRELIAKLLHDYHEVENLCVVDKDLQKALYDWYLNLKGTYLTTQVLNILLERNYLDPSSALMCRLVSTLWMKCVDEHYRSANLHSVTFVGGNDYQYPRASIFVPVEDGFLADISEYSKHGKNPFVGNRLLLEAGNGQRSILPFSTATSVINSPANEHVWRYIEHLEIEERLPFRVLNREALQPFLEKMENVKSVVYSVSTGSLDVLGFLPNLCKLEQLVFREKFPDPYPDKWRILRSCSSSLRLLCNVTHNGLGMDEELKTLNFQNLQELNLKNADWCVELLGPPPQVRNVFGNLRVMFISFSYDSGFYAWLAEVSHAVKSLVHVQILCVGRNHVSLPKLHMSKLEKMGRSDVCVTITGGGLESMFFAMVRRLKRLFAGAAECGSFKVIKTRHMLRYAYTGIPGDEEYNYRL